MLQHCRLRDLDTIVVDRQVNKTSIYPHNIFGFRRSQPASQPVIHSPNTTRTRTKTTTMMNNNDHPTNRQHRHHYHHNNRDAIFCEEQTDLLSVFQGHHYDLLTEQPPSHNPDFVVAPGSDPWLAAAQAATATATAAATAAARHDVAVRDRPHQYQQHQSSINAIIASAFAGVNPFDDRSAAAAPSSSNRNAQNSCRNNNPFEQIFGCGVGGSCAGAGFNANANATSAASPFPLAAAAAVAVSDSDDDSAIPFVAALRIDIDIDGGVGVGGTDVVHVHENHECAYAHASSGFAHETPEIPSLVFSPTSSTTSRASRESDLESPTTRVVEGRTSSSSRNEGRRLPPPDWLTFGSNNHPNPSGNDTQNTSRRRSRSSRNRNSNSYSYSSNSRSLANRIHFTNWSRLSIQAKAAAVEAKRFLKKKLVKDVSEKLVSSKALLPRRRW